MNSLKEVKAWLEKPGNSKAVLAHALGYKSTSVVDMWFQRGHLPIEKEKKIIMAIRGKKV